MAPEDWDAPSTFNDTPGDGWYGRTFDDDPEAGR